MIAHLRTVLILALCGHALALHVGGVTAGINASAATEVKIHFAPQCPKGSGISKRAAFMRDLQRHKWALVEQESSTAVYESRRILQQKRSVRKARKSKAKFKRRGRGKQKKKTQGKRRGKSSTKASGKRTIALRAKIKSSASPGRGSSACSDQMNKEMIALNNASRPGSLKQLKCDSVASQVALDWAKGMCRDGEISHRGFRNRCKKSPFRYCGENVAYNWPPSLTITVNDTHKRWMASPGHRANILRPDFNVVGYAWYVCSRLPGEDNRIYWAAFFGQTA